MAVSKRLLDEMYERALSCLDAEFDDIPAGSGGAESEAGFRGAVAETQEMSAAQAGAGDAAKVGTGQRTVARINMKQWRNSLAETASIIARKKPGFNSEFPLPYGEDDDELLTESRAIAPKAIANQTDFTDKGLEEAFVKSGDELIAAFQAALDMTNEALSHRGAATGGKASAYQRADEFFDELDIYIRNKYKNQPDKLNAWRIATHIEQAPKKKKEEEEVKSDM
jgi:hypothetical protein